MLVGTCGSNLCQATEQDAITPLTTDGVPDGVSCSSPSISADASQIAFMRGGTPYRGTRGGRVEKLLDTESGREIALSRDGASFVFRTFDSFVSGGGFTLESVLHVGGAVGSARYSSTSFVSHGGWLGNRLITTYPREEGGPDIACLTAVIPSDSKPPCGGTMAADPARNVSDAIGSPDGKLVAATVTTENASGEIVSYQVALFDAATGTPVRDLTSGPNDFAPTFSPDGTEWRSRAGRTPSWSL